MGQTYYDSTLTDAQIQQVLDAINNILTPSNNGKVLAISGGTLEARSVQWGGGYPEPTGTITLTENGLHNVKDYAEANVQVQGGGSDIEVIPLSVTENNTYIAPAGKAYSPVTVNVPTGSGDILTGSDVPSASLGSDGDIYKQVIPIPNNVSFVEFLQSSGTQYINTGIIGDQDSGYLYDQEVTIASWAFGARVSAQNRAVVITSDGGSTTADTFDLGNERKTIGSIPARRTMLLKDRKLYINSVLKAMYGMPSAFTTPNPLLLFGVYNGGSVALTSGGFKLYRAVIYSGAIPIADYIPCLDSNGVACMWNNVAQEYVYNNGTGDFSYGSASTPTELDPVYWQKKNETWEVIQQ